MKNNDIKVVGNINKFIVQLIASAIENSKDKSMWGDHMVFKHDLFTQYFKFLGAGCNGRVYAINDDLAVKVFVGGNLCCKDAKVLEQLNGSPYFPKIYAYTNEFMIVERIKGVTVNEYGQLGDGKPFNISPDFYKYMRQAIKYSFKKGLVADDLHQGNVMIREETGLPVIVDTGTFDEYREGFGRKWEERNHRKWTVWDHEDVYKALQWSADLIKNFCSVEGEAVAV